MHWTPHSPSVPGRRSTASCSTTPSSSIELRPDSCFQLHRELVQPVAKALLDRDAVAGTVRVRMPGVRRTIRGDGLSYDPIAVTRPPKRGKVMTWPYKKLKSTAEASRRTM
jgi:hypothetical protein